MFVFISRGGGVLVPVIVIACGLLLGLFKPAERSLGNSSYHVIASFLLAAGLVWLLGRRMNHRDGKGTHSLFFVPMENWAFILTALAAALVFVPSY